jgi:hypothetical protein
MLQSLALKNVMVSGSRKVQEFKSHICDRIAGEIAGANLGTINTRPAY